MYPHVNKFSAANKMCITFKFNTAVVLSPYTSTTKEALAVPVPFTIMVSVCRPA